MCLFFNILICFCLISSFSYVHGAEEFQFPAMTATIAESSPEDLKLFINLLYWSYVRSITTVQLISSAEEHFMATWKEWSSCCARFIDPRATSLYEHPSNHTDAFNHAIRRFNEAHDAYAKMVENVVHKRGVQASPLYDLVHSIRDQARKVVNAAGCDHLSALVQRCKLLIAEHSEQLKGFPDIGNIDYCFQHRGLLSDLLQTLTLFSFSRVHEHFGTKSTLLFDQFFAIQSLFYALWQKIELSRSGYYAAVYNEALRILQGLQDKKGVLVNCMDRVSALPSQLEAYA